MIDNQIFAWENYEENPNKMIGVDTIPTQKDATYNEVSNGVFTGSMAESFFTNVDKSMVPEVASVTGMMPGEIVEGKGIEMFISRTCHDSDVTKPGTSLKATYTLTDHYNMVIGGTIDLDTEHGGNRFGVVIQTLDPNYNKAKSWKVNGETMDVDFEMYNNEEGWAHGMYLYPKVEKNGEGKYVVSLANRGGDTNVLTVEIKWDDNHIETYTYTVSNDAILGGVNN